MTYSATFPQKCRHSTGTVSLGRGRGHSKPPRWGWGVLLRDPAGAGPSFRCPRDGQTAQRVRVAGHTAPTRPVRAAPARRLTPGGGRGGTSGTRSSRINRQGSHAAPHVCPRARMSHVPLRGGDCGGGRGTGVTWLKRVTPASLRGPGRRFQLKICGLTRRGLLRERAPGAGLLRNVGVTGADSPWWHRGPQWGVLGGHLQGAGAAILGPEAWEPQETRDMPLSR